MKIIRHILEGDNFRFQKSPNHGDKFANQLPDTIIIHYTAGSSAESSARSLSDPQIGASAHLVIGRDGKIIQLVPFNVIAHHAGPSSYKGRKGFNKYSIGIEIDNAGKLTKMGKVFSSWFGKTYPENQVLEAVHRNESVPSFWHTYTEKQITLTEEICKLLIEKYNISVILGHEEISPVRKIDPGPAFPLDKLRERLIVRDRGADSELKLRPEAAIGLVDANKLNIRSRNSIHSDIVAPPLARGTLLEILQEKDGWYEVQIDIKGWVKKDYVKT
jgi:N-acetylmuramoyl-L-alanine amidase